MNTASYKELTNRDNRTIAHMAARARNDTIYGGALALVYAKRLKNMGSKLSLNNVVGDVYSSSTGRWSKDHEAWQCPECGSVHLGQDNAFNCCKENWD
jgi:rubrerythrin